MKKIVPIVILVSLLLIIVFKVNGNKKEIKVESKITKEEVIDKILSKTNKIDNDFLVWINDKYGIESLTKLNDIIEKEEYSKDIWHDITGNSYLVLSDMYNNKYDDIDNVKVLDSSGDSTISFVGDVSLADDWFIMPKYDERGKGIYGILSEEVVDIMKSSTLMVANNEFTISDRGEKMPGKYYTFRGSPKRLSIYDEMGVDLVTLANNHVYDYGKDAFYDMLTSLKEYNIPYIGAGKNIEEAKRPYYFIINGYKVAFVNATRAEKLILTPEATETEGGVFRCYEPEGFASVIKSTKEESDYVVALIHWGREDSHEVEDVQVDTSKIYIDAGADIIIGSHAHVLQGLEYYNDKLIVYNLGDFIFNNETKDTGIFQIKLNDNGTMEYYFIPALESNEYTKLLYDTEKQRVINLMNSWSTNATLDENGKIMKEE